ncbi:MAG: permease [Patescibacteria group bacterium]
MKNSSLTISTIILAVLSLAALYIAFQKGKHIDGLVATKNLTLQVLPLLVFAFLLAGMLQVIIPHELIAKWIGAESGLKGIFIGTATGAFLPGGPFVTLPLVAGLAKVGAEIPVLVAMITSWSLIAVLRIPMEVGILGLRLTMIKFASVLFLAPLAGLMAKLLMRYLK